ncbi:phosphotransferase enzyme family protein [Paractinoplanes ovalisporus]|uniref:phosphotransferase enzyme family protein n=1 Tax=Paractinoplanes ovalisporus TaxID=2810368 RepID=UPI0027DCBD0F|nr:aminoglycoside phosphotransferase family protein [Actinoplanes ovalisporus]
MEILPGGINEVVKIGDSVRRPAGPWSPQVHALLRHLTAAGFTGAPEFRSAAGGHEVLSFLPGEVSQDPRRFTQALVSAAGLLRDYHDATASYAVSAPHDGWQVPARQPVEVICHGDYAPYNCALDGSRVVGVFDFDFAHPGPRMWDVAYAVYRWVPMTVPTDTEVYGTTESQARLLRTFCDVYGLDRPWRAALVDAVAARLHAMVDLMRTQAASGHAAFASHIAEGHHTLYLNDADYVLASRATFERHLLAA